MTIFSLVCFRFNVNKYIEINCLWPSLLSYVSDCLYDDGKVVNRDGTYVSCAEYMSQHGYTDCDREEVSQVCCKTCSQYANKMTGTHDKCQSSLIIITHIGLECKECVCQWVWWVGETPSLRQECQIWAWNGSDWHKMGQIREISKGGGLLGDGLTGDFCSMHML